MTGTQASESAAGMGQPPAALRTWLLFGALYSSQYVGIGFISLALVALLREHGASLAQLGLLNLLLLPMSLKFLWAPLVDRYGRHSRGHYRCWLLPTQAVMALMLALLASIEPQGDLPLHMLLVLLAFSLATATQDLALDGMATVTFNYAQRPRINGIQVGAGMLGNIVGGALVLWLYPRIGWAGCLYLLAALLGLPWLMLWGWTEPTRSFTREATSASEDTDAFTTKAATLDGAVPGQVDSPWRQLGLFWRGQLRWLLLLGMSVFAFVAFATLTPALVDAGWALEDIGSAVRVFGSVAGLLSAALAVVLLRRLARWRTLRLSLLVQALALLLLLPVLLGRASLPWVYVAIGSYYLAFSPLYASLGAVMMDKARASSAPATVYTLQNATAMLLALALSAAGLSLAQYIGSVALVGLSIACLLIAAALLGRWPDVVQVSTGQITGLASSTSSMT